MGVTADRIDLRPRDLEGLRAVLADFPGVREAVLFGSRATGLARRTSDVDLAVTAPGLSRRAWADLLERLEEAPIIHELDVVRLDLLPAGPLRDRIRREGIVIFPA